ncbi:MAG: Rha family transcriptional regulator [Magnetococcales bacterium]|nr:Rha family transcriptional regulator [Magnetococcales bacterium]
MSIAQSSSEPQQIVAVNDGKATTTSLIIAEGTQNSHESVIKLVRRYQADLEEFGLVRFEIRPRLEGQHGGSDVEFANLNEHQSTLIMTYMRNSEIVRGFKKQLVKAFFELANQRPPISSAEQLLANAQLLVEQEKRLGQVESTQNHQQVQLDQIAQRQANMDGDTGFMTALAFCRTKGVSAPLEYANRLGRLASKKCRRLKIQTGKVPDERWGSVNSYPVSVLDECYQEMRLAA